MAVDQGDVPKTVENLANGHPRLLFHLSSVGGHAANTMTEFGLLAKSPTLTPRLDIAEYYSAGAERFLSFWYPRRKEVNRGRHARTVTPTLPVTDELRNALSANIDNTDLGQDNWEKPAYKRIIDEAKTYLPGQRLGAVARVSDRDIHHLMWILPDEEGHVQGQWNIISEYTQEKPQLVVQVREILEGIEVDFMDPSLSKDVLADDIVRTYFEHQLLNVGKGPDNRRSLEYRIDLLNKAPFDEPIYERYRKMLLDQLQRRLSNLPDETSSGSLS